MSACVPEGNDSSSKILPDASLDSPVNPEPGKNSLLNQNTFLMTISPKGDVAEECQKVLMKWVEKNTLFAYVVAERGKNGQRHFHMCLAFDVARSKQRLQEDTWKRVKKWHGDSIGKYAVVVTTMYDHRWYDEYLKKESSVEVLYDEYDRDSVAKLFPTREMQQLLIESKGKRVCDTYIHEHCLLWSETDMPVTLSGALLYLRTRMFKEKSMMVIQDERRLRQLALAIYRYRTVDLTQSAEDDEWIARHEPRTLCFHPPDSYSKPSGGVIQSGGAPPVFKGGRVT